MARRIRIVAGQPAAPIRRFPWGLVGLMRPFNETIRELMEMRYLWDNSLRLDNRNLVAFLGEEPHTRWIGHWRRPCLIWAVCPGACPRRREGAGAIRLLRVKSGDLNHRRLSCAVGASAARENPSRPAAAPTDSELACNRTSC